MSLVGESHLKRELRADMLEIVFGKKGNPLAVDSLVQSLVDQTWAGTLYVGYPVFAGDEASSVTDALLTCKEHGVVIFDLSTSEYSELPPGEIEAAIHHRQKELRRRLNAKFVNNENLVNDDGVTPAVPIQVLTYAPVGLGGDLSKLYTTADSVVEQINTFAALTPLQFKAVNAEVQKTAALKPKKRRLNVRSPNSMGAIVKRLESEIANLDQWQKKAAIESPEGPQRIRGLAGSGKTIILALKAAYLHANDPEADIVVTFGSRALYQQFKSIIRRFYFDQVNDEPDWSKLRIVHAWGSGTEPGLYSLIASAAGVLPMSFGVARSKFGFANAFHGACNELLSVVNGPHFQPIFDYVLLDEAQDFTPAFFQLAYRAVKSPKRLVWAYDELQNLTDSSMPSLLDLFGIDQDGQQSVEIVNVDGQPQEDILLPICYRNPPWVLTLALGLGMGIKRGEGGYAQMFVEPEFWRDIGYEDVGGQLALGQDVRLRRRTDRSASFFKENLTPDESVSCQVFDSDQSQADWIAADIKRVMTSEELDASDILIVIPDSINSSKIGSLISMSLKLHGIASHLIGVTASRDVVFVDGSVAMTSIFRAKGNEAPLVYVVNAEYCVSTFEQGRRRNILFTAITRAKGWVRLCGVGSGMRELQAEFNAIVADGFDLAFKYPTGQEILKMKSSYKERTVKERRAVTSEIKSAQKLLQRILAGDIDIDELPPELASALRRGLR